MRHSIVVFLLLLCLIACNRAPEKASADPLMQRYEELSSEIDQRMQRDGAGQTIAFLRETVNAEPALEDVCHGLAHEIGEAAFERYGMEDALRFESDVCGSGYIHGVIEAYLADVDDLDRELLMLCSEDSPKCFHGVGHGLMDRSKNDLPGSLTYCERFTEKFQRVQCAEGVFMENFDADQVTHMTQYQFPDDPYATCRGQTEVNEGVCAFYVIRFYLRLHPRAYSDAMSWCETIPEGPRNACYKGVGDTATKQNIRNPAFVERLCEAAPLEKRRYCIEGLASYLVVHYAKISPVQAICETLKPEHQEACLYVTEQSKKFYPE